MHTVSIIACTHLLPIFASLYHAGRSGSGGMAESTGEEVPQALADIARQIERLEKVAMPAQIHIERDTEATSALHGISRQNKLTRMLIPEDSSFAPLPLKRHILPRSKMLQNLCRVCQRRPFS